MNNPFKLLLVLGAIPFFSFSQQTCGTCSTFDNSAAGHMNLTLKAKVGSESSFLLYDGSVAKYQVGKRYNNDFGIYNYTTGLWAFSVDDATGNMGI